MEPTRETTAAVNSEELELQELVRRYRVTWEARPELAVQGGALVPIGFVVQLSATHDHPVHRPSPGCPECAPLVDALKRIAHAVLPRGEHASWYDVHVSAGVIQYDPAHGNRPEVSATISILHRGQITRPPDECERACLKEIRTRLTAIGAREGRWPGA